MFRKIGLIQCYKIFHAPHSVGHEGTIVGKLFSVSPYIDIKKEAERKPFRRAKAVVKTMDKLLEGDDIAYSWKRRFEDISSGAQASARRKAAMLLHQIAARGEYLLIEKVFVVTGKRLNEGAAPNTAYNYISYIRGGVRVAAGPSRGVTRAKKRQRTSPPPTGVRV